MSDFFAAMLLGAMFGILAYASLDFIAGPPVDHDLVRCPTMLEWCASNLENRTLEEASVCAWYEGSCK